MMMLLALGLIALAPPQDPPASPPSIWDRLKIEAEGRMRGEATVENVNSSTGDEADNRYRGRFRFRLGGKYMLTEGIDLGARLSTASDEVLDGMGNFVSDTDANNPHWDFGDGDGFSGADVVMDRYYLDWEAFQELHVVVGKQPHALAVPPIYGDFLWDSDISPSGVSATFKPSMGGDLTLDGRIAGYVANEVSGDEDPKLLAVQGNAYLNLGDVKLQNSLAVYEWADNTSSSTTGPVVGNQGNTATTADFLVIEDFVSATIMGGPLDEMSAYMQFIHNLGESESGMVLGAQVGSSQWKRDNINAFFLVYALEGDALFSPVAQDDTPVAGTGLNDGDGDGMAGIVLGGTYFLRDNIGLKMWALTSNAEGAEDNPTRLRIDLDFRVK